MMTTHGDVESDTQAFIRALLDTNIILDWLLDRHPRHPWIDEAQALWAARDTGRIVAYAPASVMTDIFYITRRQTDIATAFEAVDKCFSALGILSVEGATLQAARALPGHDFEDNVQIACALAAQLDVIITRDPAGFQHAKVQTQLDVIEPQEVNTYLAG